MGTETAIAQTETIFSDDSMRDIHSWEDALALLGDAGVTPASIEDYGTGFDVVDKDSLVNVPFVILDYRFKAGDHGNFAIVRVVTKDGRKVIITDGGLGIRAQTERLHQSGAFSGIMVKGLVRSDYDYVDSAGDRKPASTFYYAGM